MRIFSLKGKKRIKLESEGIKLEHPIVILYNALRKMPDGGRSTIRFYNLPELASYMRSLWKN